MQIYNEKGNLVSLSSLGLIGLKLHVPPPLYEYETDAIDGMAGEIILGRKLRPRELVAELWTKSDSYSDSFRTRDLLYGFFGSQNSFYIGDVKGKRWKVSPNAWTIERINHIYQDLNIPLIAPTGTSETTNIINRNYAEASFSFKNEGTFPIDMRVHAETEITFKGESSDLTITNITTGDTWKYNGNTTVDDEIKLVGVRSLKNSQSIFGDTNKKLISFAPGNNKFEISGITGDFELTISTRFYFL